MNKAAASGGSGKPAGRNVLVIILVLLFSDGITRGNMQSLGNHGTTLGAPVYSHALAFSERCWGRPRAGRGISRIER